ncbi:MAG: hypothetical protein ACSHX0_06420 [Akkermansiaceae bacterium]
MKIQHTVTTSALALAATLVFASCGKDEVPSAQTSAPSSALETILVSTMPESAESISQIRQSVEVGKDVTLSGKVMGSMEPFIEDRAMVLLGDPAIITSCDLRPGDNCPTPWDVCCDDHDAITASIATIQVLGEDGKPLKQGLKGVNGIKELSNLVVTGTIAEGSNSDNLLINAKSIFVQK